MKCGQSGKRRYESQTVALGAAFSLLERGRDLGHRPLNVYQCVDCGDFHVGHRPVVLAVAKVATTSPAPDVATVKCSCHCSKVATDKVETLRGVIDVCKTHAKRLRKVYAQFPEIGVVV